MENEGKYFWFDINKNEIKPERRNIHLIDYKHSFCIISNDEKEKYSLIDICSKKTIIPYLYDSICKIPDGIQLNPYFGIEQKGKWGICNSKGEIIIKPLYDKIVYKVDTFFMAILNGKLGLLNLSGIVHVPFEYDLRFGNPLDVVFPICVGGYQDFECELKIIELYKNNMVRYFSLVLNRELFPELTDKYWVHYEHHGVFSVSDQLYSDLSHIEGLIDYKGTQYFED